MISKETVSMVSNDLTLLQVMEGADMAEGEVMCQGTVPNPVNGADMI
jgi:hypothetical protein